MKKKIFIGFLLLLLIVFVTGHLHRKSIFEKAGQFMAPQGDYTADVVILEGAAYISHGFIKTGTEMITSGKVRKMIVVIHLIAPADRPFGINGDYPDAVRQKLQKLGLSDDQYRIIVTPIRQPVTLKEAQFVLNNLKQDKISSAILIAQSFHTRRSYMAYAYTGEPLKIKIYPLASFTAFKKEKWWADEWGWREFLTESGKLFYYLTCRHIPFKFSY